MARWRPVVEIVSEAGSSAHERGEGHSADRWLTAGVRGIGTASLLADLGHEVPTALLPSLLTSTLGAPASALGLDRRHLRRARRGDAVRWWPDRRRPPSPAFCRRRGLHDDRRSLRADWGCDERVAGRGAPCRSVGGAWAARAVA